MIEGHSRKEQHYKISNFLEVTVCSDSAKKQCQSCFGWLDLVEECLKTTAELSVTYKITFFDLHDSVSKITSMLLQFL